VDRIGLTGRDLQAVLLTVLPRTHVQKPPRPKSWVFDSSARNCRGA
jgi:hypothetical protein